MLRHRSLRLAVVALMLAGIPALAFGSLITISLGPPPIPVYAQPPCPASGYMWTPGYWAWSNGGYFWVPGTWVMPPQPSLLWTPGYWGWNNGGYFWHPGYWGPHVGYYGGINYGYGYPGNGFFGGEWRGNHYFYNRSVTNITNVTNVYNRTVYVNNSNRVSYNGGPGGRQARPTPQETQWQNEGHFGATPAQMQQEHGASQNRQLWASHNAGRPPVAATQRPGEFSGRGAVGASSAGGPVPHDTHNPAPQYTPSPRTPQSAMPPRGNVSANPSGSSNGNAGRPNGEGRVYNGATSRYPTQPANPGTSNRGTVSTPAPSHNNGARPSEGDVYRDTGRPAHGGSPQSSLGNRPEPSGSRNVSQPPSTARNDSWPAGPRTMSSHDNAPQGYNSSAARGGSAPPRNEAPAPHASGAPQRGSEPHGGSAPNRGGGNRG